jgi:pimeloyl-ACP methyl ester carboxylesterase
MPTAHLHDGSALDVAVFGDGPAVVIPVRTAEIDGDAAEQMRAWGADPNLGHTLATGLAEAGLRVVAADYEGHLTDHPKPHTLTADAVAADLLAVADAAGVDRFAYYGYSWLAVVGLQLALRSPRVRALAMGGYPPIGGPYAAMLAVTRTAHQMALAARDQPPAPAAAQASAVEATPGDWDSVPFDRTPDQTQQYVTLYESLDGFDDRAVHTGLSIPRLAFAGADDNIAYGPKWDDAYVAIAEPLAAHRDALIGYGWSVRLIPDTDHMSAMQAVNVLPILVPWLLAQAG